VAISYCPYTNSSPPTCQLLSPLLSLRGKRGREFHRALTEVYNTSKIEVKEIIRSFEEFASNFASTLLKVAEIIPPSYINVPLTFLNYPEICLYVTELSLSKRKYQKLQELGYDVDWGCVVACGYGDLTVKRRGKRITWTVIECMCHPGHYFLVLKPIGKKR